MSTYRAERHRALSERLWPAVLLVSVAASGCEFGFRAGPVDADIDAPLADSHVAMDSVADGNTDSRAMSDVARDTADARGDVFADTACAPDGNCPGTDPLGTSCSSDHECASDHCADGVCCDTACMGQCESCSPTTGVCGQTTGAPVGSRTTCASDGSSCGGTCGSNRMMCDYPTSSCRQQSCCGATEIAAGNCDGAGNCAAPQTRSCSPYVCFGNSCLTSCQNDGDCNGGYCNGGTCLSTKPTGRSCGSSSECTLGFCVDGYCCNTGCTGQCEACNVTPGVCNPVAGTPVGGRTACTSDPSTSACTGTCDGSNRAACAYPSGACSYCSTSVCGTAFVPAPGVRNGGTCSNGTCTGGTLTCCGAYTCTYQVVTRTPFCFSSCTSNAECYMSASCSGGSCI